MILTQHTAIIRRKIEGMVTCTEALHRDPPPQICEEDVPHRIMHVLTTSAEGDIRRAQYATAGQVLRKPA
jgi:hypothetical protein